MGRLTGHNNLSSGGIKWEGIKKVFLACGRFWRHLLVIQCFQCVFTSGLDTYFQDPWNELSPGCNYWPMSCGCWILVPLLTKSVCSNVDILQLMFTKKRGQQDLAKPLHQPLVSFFQHFFLPLSFNDQNTCIQNKSPGSGEQLCTY